MVEVPIHGRGGQGVVTAAELLSVAAIRLAPDGSHGNETGLDHCKGCGICAAESPAGAIEMVPEEV